TARVRYQRAAGVSESTVGSKKILYHPVHKKAIVLNPIGSWFWEQLAEPQPRDLAQVLGLLRAQYPDIETGLLERDLESYVAQLQKEEVVVLTDDAKESV
ncbi:unnamed protein product, partial [Phaeothamnion confervicola]